MLPNSFSGQENSRVSPLRRYFMSLPGLRLEGRSSNLKFISGTLHTSTPFKAKYTECEYLCRSIIKLIFVSSTDQYATA